MTFKEAQFCVEVMTAYATTNYPRTHVLPCDLLLNWTGWLDERTLKWFYEVNIDWKLKIKEPE